MKACEKKGKKEAGKVSMMRTTASTDLRYIQHTSSRKGPGSSQVQLALRTPTMVPRELKQGTVKYSIADLAHGSLRCPTTSMDMSRYNANVHQVKRRTGANRIRHATRRAVVGL